MKYNYTFFVNNRAKSPFRLLYFIFEYLKIFFYRNYYLDIIGFYKILKYSGHPVVVECLEQGSKKLGLNFNFYKNDNKFYEIAIVNSGIENLEFCINKKKEGKIKFIAAGPNLVVSPKDYNSILTSKFIDIVITPSKWVSEGYIKIKSELTNKIYEWSSGIDHNYWTENKKKRKFITFYLKYSAGPIPKNIKDYISFVKNLGYIPKIIEYNKYNRKKYRKILNESILIVYFSHHESQGLAIAEAWSCNTPTLIWNKQETILDGLKIESSCCPYLTNECGNFFNNLDEFKKIFEESIFNYMKFKPREWVINNLTFEISVNKLNTLIKNKIKD